MKTKSHLTLRSGRLTLVLLAVWTIAIPLTQVQAGSLVIPAWSFARGNVRINADPDGFADAGPVVVGGPEQAWGWTVEYDIDIPVTAGYTLHICYASAEARPVRVFLDGRGMDRNLGRGCEGVTYWTQGDKSAWNSSKARWEGFYRRGYSRSNRHELIRISMSKGVHTLKFARSGPLPHLVALRLDTQTAFPKDGKPPEYKVRDINSVPAKFRKAFESTKAKTAALGDPGPAARAAGSFDISAWTFDRGNARIYASPDQYADCGPVVGGDPKQTDPGVIEYDIDLPVTAEYRLQIRYSAAEARPVDVFVDGKQIGKGCHGVTFSTTPMEQPDRVTWNSNAAMWDSVYDRSGRTARFSVTKGRHTVKLTRSGGLPNIEALRLLASKAFPKGWRTPRRRVKHLASIPPEHRATVLPPGSVNIAALRVAVRDTMATFGRRYPGGKQYLKQLSALETRQIAVENGTPEQQKEVHDALDAVRRGSMLAHPALKFDKLLFLKRSGSHYGHTYADQTATGASGNLCILSPVGPGGKVTTLVPELDGGLFDRFDLSFDAKKVVFGYKKKGGAFRIYEIDINPTTGLMTPGSLRQLTFGGAEETQAIARQYAGGGQRFEDMDPCYLPNGKIVFTSTRSTRYVFCSPGFAVTTLHIMDSDGKNLRRLSESPLNESTPSVLDDGRVLYTRWEYIDKGLGNGAGLWAMRPDGSGSDHVYKNNTVRPAGMNGARKIPGSRRIVTIGGPHHFISIGPVVLVDPRRSRRGTDAMTCITPETGYPSMFHATNRFGFFTDPYPFSEKFFLVSHTPSTNAHSAAAYGIYVLDAWGNRAELYRDPKTSCFEPFPLRPRRKPPVIAPIDRKSYAKKKSATLFIQDVYQGMTGIERGRVKYVRVMGALEWPWSQRGLAFQLGMNVDPHRKKVYGVAKVGQDGSAYFTVPAEQNIFFHALDEDYMALQQMPTFINLMPGETRSCIGCHERRKNAPSLVRARPLALNRPPQSLVPQPGDKGPRMVHYASDVQPTLDKHCIGCHSGANPKGRLDLTGVPTAKWNRSYENLITKGLVSYADCRSGRSHFEAVPPLTLGSHRSKLPVQIRKAPCKTKLTQAEFVRIVTWIDANIPYYGTYRGSRDLKDKGSPNFRLPPLVAKH